MLTTQAGDLDLKIPKVRSGSFFPSLLERRRRIDRALFAMVMEAYVHGVSTRSVDDLVKALGADTGISKSEVSRICGELDEELTAFKERPLDHTVFPYVFLDATYYKARVNHRITSQAVVIATGISATGHREILGHGGPPARAESRVGEAGDSESKPFRTKFLRSLRARGLENVQLVISDSHSGLVAAIRTVFLGSAWQRCRVHFVRDVFSVIEKGSGEMVAATIRTIFAQTTGEAVRAQLNVVADMLGRQFPQVKRMLLDAAVDITAFADFPPAHWKKIWSTNPLERLNREIKRRADVVQVFPNPALRRTPAGWAAPSVSGTGTSPHPGVGSCSSSAPTSFSPPPSPWSPCWSARMSTTALSSADCTRSSSTRSTPSRATTGAGTWWLSLNA